MMEWNSLTSAWSEMFQVFQKDDLLKRSGVIPVWSFAFYIVVVNDNQVMTMAVFMAMVFVLIHICTYPHIFMCFPACSRMIQMAVVNVSQQWIINTREAKYILKIL